MTLHVMQQGYFKRGAMRLKIWEVSGLPSAFRILHCLTHKTQAWKLTFSTIVRAKDAVWRPAAGLYRRYYSNRHCSVDMSPQWAACVGHLTCLETTHDTQTCGAATSSRSEVWVLFFCNEDKGNANCSQKPSPIQTNFISNSFQIISRSFQNEFHFVFEQATLRNSLELTMLLQNIKYESPPNIVQILS